MPYNDIMLLDININKAIQYSFYNDYIKIFKIYE